MEEAAGEDEVVRGKSGDRCERGPSRAGAGIDGLVFCGADDLRALEGALGAGSIESMYDA